MPQTEQYQSLIQIDRYLKTIIAIIVLSMPRLHSFYPLWQGSYYGPVPLALLSIVYGYYIFFMYHKLV